MSGIQTNRSNISLPMDVSSEIIQKTQESSAIMQLARDEKLPGRGITIPVILGDPEAAWVGETEKKPVSNPEFSTKQMTPYTLAVIVPFSNQFKRDMAALYDACIQRLPGALAKKFDHTCFGGVEAPGSNFDTLAGATAVSINPETYSDVLPSSYDGLVQAQLNISTAGYELNGWALSPQGQAILLRSRDEDGRPLFINNIATDSIPAIFGAPTKKTKGAFIDGSPKVVGFAGDWNQARYGVVQGVDISISDQATLDLGNGQSINLWQQNMFAVRAEIEVGFIAEIKAFNKLTSAGSTPSF